MFRRSIIAAAALAVGVTAQTNFAQATEGDISYAINIPTDTAKAGKGSIFFQMVAPSGTQWLGLGQGSSMSGANIFMLYSDGNGGVTLSPRLGKGEQAPNYDASTATSVTVLSGSTSNSDGSMTANIRCDGCISWSGGSMSPTDSSSSWIWAVRTGDPIDSSELSESLQQHSTMGTMSIDLTKGVGGSSSNPFVSSDSASTSASATPSTTVISTAGTLITTVELPSSTGSATASGTASITDIVPQATSSGSSSSTSSSSVPRNSARVAHGNIMAALFLFLFPLFALTLYLPWAKRVRFVHAPLQVVSIILLIVGLATGVTLAKQLDMLDGYHQVIGYIIVACLIFFQPALGIYQHIHYHKTGNRSALGVFHQWLGRIVILAGVVNGGLGLMQTGPVGSIYVPRGGVIGYSVVAVVVFLIYVTVVFVSKRRAQNAPVREKPYDRGYEMHPSSNESPMSPTDPNYRSRNYMQQSNGQSQRHR